MIDAAGGGRAARRNAAQAALRQLGRLRLGQHLGRITMFALVGIVVAGGLVRFGGITWGAPFVYHPDESLLVKPAMRMVATRDWNPHSFFYPSLLVDVETVVVGIQHAVMRLPLNVDQGWLFPTEALPEQFPAFLVGRVLVSICGLLTIVATFALARRLGGPLVGIVAAIVVAFAPLHVQNSRYMTTDVPVTLWCALVLWASARAFDEPDRSRWWIVAATFVGLATSTKWNGIAVGLVPAVLFVASRPRPLRLRSIIGSPVPYAMAVAAAGALIVTTPAVVFSASEVLDWWRIQAVLYSNPRLPSNVPGWLFQARELTIGIVGQIPLLGVVVPIGFGALVLSRLRVAWAMAAYLLLYLAILSVPATRYARNILPVLPVVAVGIGLAFGKAARVVSSSASLSSRSGPMVVVVRRATRGVGAAILGLSLVGAIALVAADVEGAQLQDRPDTRTIAHDWVLANVPSTAILAREDFSPQFGQNDFRTRNRSPLSMRTLAWYRQLDVNYLIVTGPNISRFFDNPATPIQNAFYHQVLALPEVFRVDAATGRPGVTIRIFRLLPIDGGP